jgi:hypothetical protein
MPFQMCSLEQFVDRSDDLLLDSGRAAGRVDGSAPESAKGLSFAAPDGQLQFRSADLDAQEESHFVMTPRDDPEGENRIESATSVAVWTRAG